MNGLGRRAFVALAGTAAIGAKAWAADDVLAKVKSSGTLRVGTETQFAPFDFLENGKATGLNYDLFAELGKDMGVKIEWVALPWESVLPGLDAGKFDMVAGPATITKARMERYRFTPPIAEATCGILKKAGDNSINKPEDIAGKAVGSGKATSQLEQLRRIGRPVPRVVRGPIREAAGRVAKTLWKSFDNEALARGLRISIFTQELFGTGNDGDNRAAVRSVARHGSGRVVT